MNDQTMNKHALKTILDKYIRSCPTDELENKILSVVCPFLKQSINDIVDDIENKLDDVEFMKHVELTTFDNQLIEIKNFLVRWRKIIQHVLSIDGSPSNIKSLLQYFPIIVIKICSHCKNKRKNYFRRTLPILLQDIYRDVCSLVKSYCLQFRKRSQYLQNSYEDLELWKSVIRNLGDMVPHTAYGINTMIHIWRTFCHITVNIDVKALKQKDWVELVRSYFKSIWNSCIEFYKHIINMREECDFINRARLSNVLFKNFLHLHSLYCDELCSYPMDDDFTRDMIHELIRFVGYYELSYSSDACQHSCRIRDEISKNNWPKIFMGIYKKSDYFLAEFYCQAEEVKNIDDPDFALGFHFCLLHHQMFDIPDLVDMTLVNINYIQVEIMEKVIEIHDNWSSVITGIRPVRIYDYTLTMLCQFCKFIANHDSFSIYEDILLKHLLSEQFWSSLLAYDILIHCYACSNKDVAFTHIQYFTMAYETLSDREDDCFGVVMLRKLILDIYEMLPEKKVEDFLEKCKSPRSLLLILKSNSKIHSRKELLIAYKKLKKTSDNNFRVTVENLERQPTTKNWIQFIQLLTDMGVERKKLDDECSEKLLDITYTTLESVKNIDEGRQQRVMYDLILKLFDCAQFEDTENRTFSFNRPLFMTLSEGLISIADVQESLLIKICHYLTNNVVCLVGSYSEYEMTILSALFIYLLESNSPFVKQEALQCFDEITDKLKENIVEKISSDIAKRPKLYEAVPAYLKREVYPTPKDNNSVIPGWNNLVEIVENFKIFSSKHKCYKDEVRERDEKLPKLNQESLEMRIRRLTNELSDLTRENINVVPIAAEELKNICRLFIEN